MDWRRVTFTEHMTEVAGLVAECQVVLDFGRERACYDVKVYEALKGGGDDPFFAVGTNRDDPEGYRPLGTATSPEEALERCLHAAGIHHRRRLKQAGD